MRKRWMAIALMWVLLCLCAPGGARGAQEEPPPALEAAVGEAETLLLAQGYPGAESIMALAAGTRVRVTRLGTSYCAAEAGGVAGYIPSDALVFDVLNGAQTVLCRVDIGIYGDKTLAIREKPSLSVPAFAFLRFGQVLLLLEEEAEFAQIAAPEGTGFVRAQHIKKVTPRKDGWKRVADADGARVSFRADKQYGNNMVINRLSPGEIVQVISDKKGWTYAEACGQYGYIVSKYLEKIQ